MALAAPILPYSSILKAAARSLHVAYGSGLQPPRGLPNNDAMTMYRIMTVGHDGRFAGPPAIIECDHDRDILAYAAKLANGHAVEIWYHKRFVGRISPALSPPG
jgi:hypothetical protein